MRVAPQAIFLSITIAVVGCSGSGGGRSRDQGGSPSAGNRPPTIVGVASSRVTPGEPYEFVPSAHDPDGDRLEFQIDGIPSWARFDHATGRLWGTPQERDVGIVRNIRIRVTDGRHVATLDSFSIAVDQVGTGSATLSWNPPTENSDGSVLTDLAGYRIYYGRNPAMLNHRIDLDNPGLTRYVVENLFAARWFFAMTSVAGNGLESRRSRIVSLRVGCVDCRH
jgi:hypothetical protein